MLSDLVHPSHVNATAHFPWSSSQAEVSGTQRNESSIAKANRQTTPTEWQVTSIQFDFIRLLDSVDNQTSVMINSHKPKWLDLINETNKINCI